MSLPKSGPEGSLLMTEHCRGCACDMFNRDIVLVKMSGQMLQEMQVEGWSEPIRVRLELEGGTGVWTMMCQTVDRG